MPQALSISAILLLYCAVCWAINLGVLIYNFKEFSKAAGEAPSDLVFGICIILFIVIGPITVPCHGVDLVKSLYLRGKKAIVVLLLERKLLKSLEKHPETAQKVREAFKVINKQL